MFEWLEPLLGTARDVRDVTAPQMALRTVVVYAFTILAVRLTSRPFHGKATPFDLIVGIMLGSVTSRGINGSAPLAPTLSAAAVLLALHALIAFLSYHFDWFGPLVKGEPLLLIKDGEIQGEHLARAQMSRRDLAEALRNRGYRDDPSEIELAYLERNGKVSVIPYREAREKKARAQSAADRPRGS